MNDAPKPRMPNSKVLKSKMLKRGNKPSSDTPKSKALKARESEGDFRLWRRAKRSA